MNIVVDPDDLVVHRILAPEIDPRFVVLKTIGLDGISWEFSRGARIYKDYFIDEKLAAKVHYTYKYENENRDIDSYVKTIEWYKENGSIGVSRQIPSQMNIKKKEDLNVSIRLGRIRYLRKAGELLAQEAANMPEPYKSAYLEVALGVKSILEHYNDLIVNYTEYGTIDFEKSINSEQDETRSALLGKPVQPPSDRFPKGLAMLQAINYQLKGSL